MRFGIDVGTTRTIAAVVDRGNYPVVTVEDYLGDAQEYIPSVVALDGDRLVAGWEAMKLGPDDPSLVRSFKRIMSDHSVTAGTPVQLGHATRPLGEVLRVYAETVVNTLRDFQATLDNSSPIEVVLGIPANAHTAQRLLTLSAFSEAGAEVAGLINEPSAAAFEYTHRHARTLNSRRSGIVIYDLGGGTFDASLIRVDGTTHEVMGSLGISHLGGDDFDVILAECALRAAGKPGVPSRTLIDEARSAKESLVPQSRRLVIDVEGQDVVVPVADFYDAAMPLVEQTIEVMTPLIGTDDLRESEIAGIYLVGGASSLPLISRVLRERFGRRVHRAPFTAGATAVGLAIAADPDSGFHLRDKLSRGIGVFREFDGGRAVSFDPLITRETKPDADGRITVTRRYRAAHNVGWFRFVEYDSFNEEDGSPGDISLLGELKVPFDSSIIDVDAVEITRFDGPEIEETVMVNSDGIASIRIAVQGGVVVEHTPKVTLALQ